MEKKCVIIGKGPSLKRCKKEFIDKHDDIVICNYLKFSGYEEILPKRATMQFRNASCKNFTKKSLISLGLKEVISTSATSKLCFESHYGVAVLTQPLYDACVSKDGLNRKVICIKNEDYKIVDPSTGVIALDYICKTNKYNTITLVGFDLFMSEQNAYYYKSIDDWPENMKYLLGEKNIFDEKGYVTGNAGKDFGHCELDSLNFILKTFKNFSKIKFRINSNHTDLIEKSRFFNNVEIL